MSWQYIYFYICYRYKLAVNTAGEARRGMQASARARLEGNDLELVEDYLAHAANVDDQFYEFNQPINVCRAMLLMTGYVKKTTLISSDFKLKR